MTLEHGLLYHGKIIPGSEWVLRDPSAWYSPGDDDVYVRVGAPEILTYHWTAGPRRGGLFAAQKTYRAMQARRKNNGEEMSVSAQMVLADDGQIFQLADLELCCVHADREFNRRGVGIEYTLPGTVARAEELDRPSDPHERRLVAGHYVDALVPSPAALATAVKFAEFMAASFGIPRITYTRRTRLNGREMREAKGAVEHFHAVSTTKVDAAGFFVDALAAAGWAQR